MKDLKKLLGLQAKDKITNFSGTVTAVASYITGCDQISITAGVKDNYSAAQSGWYDVNRIEVQSNSLKIELDTEEDKGAMSSPLKS